MGKGRLPRVRMGIGLGLALLLWAAAPAAAWELEGDYKDCGNWISYLRARYNDEAGLKPPGGTYAYYYDDDGQWHTRERNGGYSGNWQAWGDPHLDFGSTYAACRNYG